MLNKIIRFFRPEPSVETITASFTKQAAALEALAEAKTNAAVACDDQMENLRKARNSAVRESLQARKVADRINALLD